MCVKFFDWFIKGKVIKYEQDHACRKTVLQTGHVNLGVL